MSIAIDVDAPVQPPSRMAVRRRARWAGEHQPMLRLRLGACFAESPPSARPARSLNDWVCMHKLRGTPDRNSGVEVACHRRQALA